MNRKNVIGERYHRLVVIADAPDKRFGKNVRRMVYVRCDCGTEKVVRLLHLRGGNTRSCGCINRPSSVGNRYGRLVVTADAPDKRFGKETKRMVHVRCDCGTEKVANLSDLRIGRIKSCGCISRELQASWVPPMQSHGMSYTSEYCAWTNMQQRCYNKNHKSYPDYGGRGIEVCDRWLESFENFYTDMGDKPTPEHSIDRIDNDGNYEWVNCRWTTAAEQANNRRKRK